MDFKTKNNLLTMKKNKNIILGTNAVGHDSSIVYYDNNTGDVFALDNERLTRIKHDGTSIKDCMLEFLRWNTNNASVKYLDLNESYNNEECFTVDYLLNKQIMLEVKRIFDLCYIKEISAIMKLPILERMKKYIGRFPYSWKLICLTPLNRLLELTDLVLKQHFNYCHSTTNSRLKRYISHDLIKFSFKKLKVNFYDHHLCHCIAAYYLSPFDKSLSISLDYSGDGYFSKVYRCESGIMTEVATSPVIRTENSYLSIGKVYSMVTGYLGFIPNSDEGKVEALAAYGAKENELYYELMKNTYIREDLGISLDKSVTKLIQTDYLEGISKKYGKEGVAAAVQGFLEDFTVPYVKKNRRGYRYL